LMNLFVMSATCWQWKHFLQRQVHACDRWEEHFHYFRSV
jgi:hypothetical protein